MNILRDVSAGIHPIIDDGEMAVYSGGRGVGKSFYYSIPGYPKTTASLNRLMPEYKFSRKWHIIDFYWKDHDAIHEWCREQFGPHPLNPDAWCRWHQRSMGQIHFRDEQDAMLFILRWA